MNAPRSFSVPGGLDVSRETIERLHIYHDTLLEWQPKINLVSNSTLADAWNRHFIDSLQLLPLIGNKNVPIVDLGSGAGFPGMVLSIAGCQQLQMVESDTKKIIFLREVARLTNATPLITHARIEEATIESPRIITSRALATLHELLSYAIRFVSHETICLFPKGKNYAIEIEDAKKYWSFDHHIFPSITDTQAVIVQLANIRRRAENDPNSFHRESKRRSG